MNQRSGQNTKNSIEKDFYKLTNNSNFRYDSCNNLDNCQFVPIFDKLQKFRFESLKFCIKSFNQARN